ncbi:MAG: MFS transporter [Nanoarchaeota archaeon]|nr:MFS transporter [Nanoarchaeota archaeon]
MNKINYESNIKKFYWLKFLQGLDLLVAVYVLFMLANKISMTQLMILETILIAVVLLMEVPSGAFADLYGRKTSLVISMFLASISFILFGFGRTYFVFLIAQILMALSWAAETGADSALIYDSLKEHKKEKQFSKIFGKGGFIVQITWAVVGLISVFLAIKLGYRPLFFITAGIWLIGGFIALTFKEPPIHKTSKDRNYFKHLREGVKFSYQHKTVKNLIIYYGMFAAFTHLAWFLIQPYYDFSTLPKYFTGIAMFLYFGICSLGYLFAEKFVKKIKEERALLVLLLTCAISFIGFFFINKFLGLILIATMSFASGVRDVVVLNGINKHTDSSHRATVISVQSVSKSLMYAIFAPLLGYFTDIFTVEAAFLLMGISLFIFFLYYLFLSIKKRKDVL